MELNELVYIIPPAIIIGFVVYYIKILGRIISDFEPYSDDRKYAEDFFGFTFFIGQILFPLFWAFLTYYLISKFTNFDSFTWFPLVVTYLVGSYYQIKYFGLSINFFDRKELMEKIKGVLNIISIFNKPISKKIGVWLRKPKKKNFILLYIMFTLAIFNYFSKNYFVIILNYFTIFVMILIIACVYAMSTRSLLNANVYFGKKSDDIKGCKIIKIAEDTVRIKHNEKIFLLNKSKIKYIELVGTKVQK